MGCVRPAKNAFMKTKIKHTRIQVYTTHTLTKHKTQTHTQTYIVGDTAIVKNVHHTEEMCIPHQ